MKFLREYTISTHAPTGWATRGPLGLFAALVAQISTHAPAGGATSVRIAEPAWAILFLLTPLREGRLRRHDGLHRAGMHFYSRPCGRGDFAASISLRSCIISTHAPAGGATGCKPYSFPNWKISTHAPAGGATSHVVCVEDGTYYFYSRPCGRGDISGGDRRHFANLISTHAPAGGATGTRENGLALFGISTHAPAGGATRRRLPSGVHRLISTHAPAGGATTWRAALRTLPVYFYSRPCGRGDIPQLHPSTQHHAFLLTPLREGRPAALHVLVCPFVISTHAPAGGATSAISRYSTSG